MKTYEGTITAGAHQGHVRVELPDGHRISLRAGEQVLQQAQALLGRRVRFQAMLHESTLSLASPIFVIGSQFGLQAVRAEAERQAAE
jgi:hypothetical protein